MRRAEGHQPSLAREAHARVEKTLSTNRPALDSMAKLLLQGEVVDRAALAHVLRAPAPERDNAEKRPAAFQALTPAGRWHEATIGIMGSNGGDLSEDVSARG